MRIQLTTNPGLEDVVGLELRARAAAAGVALGEVQVARAGAPGRVEAEVQAPVEEIRALTGELRSVHHVLRPLARLELGRGDPLQALFEGIAAIDAPELETATAFRVTAERSGEHAFTSIDVQKVAGSAVRSRRPIPVSMKDFDLELRVEVEGEVAHVAVQHTRRALSRRQVGPWHPRTALKPNVAYAMLVLAVGLDAGLAAGPDGDLAAGPLRLGDPCCGSGTILAEAGALYPQARLLGIDRYEAPLQGCRDNLAAAGLLHRAELRLADARAMAPEPGEQRSLDVIVTNPPFGLRLGAGIDFDQWYRSFLLACAGVLRPGGRLCLLALRRRALNRALEQVGGLRVLHARVISTGSAWPGLFLLERV